MDGATLEGLGCYVTFCNIAPPFHSTKKEVVLNDKFKGGNFMQDDKLERLVTDIKATTDLLITTSNQITKMDGEVRHLRGVKVTLQKELTRLEVCRKEMLGEIHIVKVARPSLKIKVRDSIIPPDLAKKFSALSSEDKADAVREMLEGLR